MSKSKSFRNFACIVYPESAPKNWRSILENFHVPAAVSPCHNHDFLESGDPEKPHFHVLVHFSGKKTPSSVCKMFLSFGGVGCEIVQDLTGYSQYLCHINVHDERKAKYNPEDVVCYAGFDYMKHAFILQDTDPIFEDMIRFIEDNSFLSFSQFLLYCLNHNKLWFKVLQKKGIYVIKEFLKSKTWTLQNQTLLENLTLLDQTSSLSDRIPEQPYN